MKIKLLFSFGLIMLCFIGFGQQKKEKKGLWKRTSAFESNDQHNYGYNEGYYITNTGDKIYGKIKYATAIPYHHLNEIKFKGNSGKSELSADDIAGFQIEGKEFATLNFKETNGKVFLEIYEKGCVNLYFNETNKGIEYKKDEPEFFIVKSETGEVFSYKSFDMGTHYKVGTNGSMSGGAAKKPISKTAFNAQLNRLSAFLSDNQYIVDKLKTIEKAKDFSGVRSVVKKYNADCKN